MDDYMFSNEQFSSAQCLGFVIFYFTGYCIYISGVVQTTGGSSPPPWGSDPPPLPLVSAGSSYLDISLREYYLKRVKY